MQLSWLPMSPLQRRATSSLSIVSPWLLDMLKRKSITKILRWSRSKRPPARLFSIPRGHRRHIPKTGFCFRTNVSPVMLPLSSLPCAHTIWWKFSVRCGIIPSRCYSVSLLGDLFRRWICCALQNCKHVLPPKNNLDISIRGC